MNFKDKGIILAVKKYGESSLILKILSKEHGIYAGLVRGGFSNKKNISLYQVGNLVDFTWQARIEDSLGSFKIELNKSFIAEILSGPLKLNCLLAIVNIIAKNILERERQAALFLALEEVLNKFSESDLILLKNYTKFEIALLQMLGYGIDLSACVVTGKKEDLCFVSPKSGKAVCREVGEKYQNKLLPLPFFLTAETDPELLPTKHDLLLGLKLSGFFIGKYLEPVEARNRLIKLVELYYE